MGKKRWVGTRIGSSTDQEMNFGRKDEGSNPTSNSEMRGVPFTQLTVVIIIYPFTILLDQRVGRLVWARRRKDGLGVWSWWVCGQKVASDAKRESLYHSPFSRSHRPHSLGAAAVLPLPSSSMFVYNPDKSGYPSNIHSPIYCSIALSHSLSSHAPLCFCVFPNSFSTRNVNSTITLTFCLEK